MLIKNKKKWGMLSLILLLTISLFACSDEEHLKDLHHYIDNLKKSITKHKRRSILADIRLPVPVSFQALQKQRDPFQDEQATYAGTELNNPLLAFPLKSFELMGTIMRGQQVWAVIKAPDNRIYQVTINDRIGNHYGRIVNIYANYIKIEEEVSAQDAGASGLGMIKRIVTLQIKGGA